MRSADGGRWGLTEKKNGRREGIKEEKKMDERSEEEKIK